MLLHLSAILVLLLFNKPKDYCVARIKFDFTTFFFVLSSSLFSSFNRRILRVRWTKRGQSSWPLTDAITVVIGMPLWWTLIVRPGVLALGLKCSLGRQPAPPLSGNNRDDGKWSAHKSSEEVAPMVAGMRALLAFNGEESNKQIRDIFVCFCCFRYLPCMTISN